MDKLDQFVLECEPFLPQLTVEHARIVDVQLLTAHVVACFFLHCHVSLAAIVCLLLLTCFAQLGGRLLTLALAEAEHFDEKLDEEALDIATSDNSVC